MRTALLPPGSRPPPRPDLRHRPDRGKAGAQVSAIVLRTATRLGEAVGPLAVGTDQRGGTDALRLLALSTALTTALGDPVRQAGAVDPPKLCDPPAPFELPLILFRF